MFASALLLVALLTCCYGSEFGTTYDVFPFRIHDSGAAAADASVHQKGESIDVENKLPTSYSSQNAVHYDDKMNFDYTAPGHVPFPGEEKLNLNSMYPYAAPPLHPLFYDGPHTNSLPQFPTLDGDHYAAQPFRTDYSYAHYQFPSHPFPPAIEEIRYVPLGQETPFYKPGHNSNTQEPQTSTPPTPYLSTTTTTTDTVHTPSGIEEDMVKRIIQIVSDFRKFNTTQVEPAFRADIVSPSMKNDSTLITTTTVEENNRTEVESTVDMGTDESKTEIHTSGNRTESAQVMVQVDPTTEPDVTPSKQTVKPLRYVVAQFVDTNGNPCVKEFVMTEQRKTYHVYTCEEKSVPIPPPTTVRSSVTHYKNELNTTSQDADRKLEDIVTTPMTAEDPTLPTMLNDYIMYNRD